MYYFLNVENKTLWNLNFFVDKRTIYTSVFEKVYELKYLLLLFIRF